MEEYDEGRRERRIKRIETKMNLIWIRFYGDRRSHNDNIYIVFSDSFPIIAHCNLSHIRVSIQRPSARSP